MRITVFLSVAILAIMSPLSANAVSGRAGQWLLQGGWKVWRKAPSATAGRATGTAKPVAKAGEIEASSSGTTLSKKAAEKALEKGGEKALECMINRTTPHVTNGVPNCKARKESQKVFPPIARSKGYSDRNANR